jgi:hypothetical protein
MIRLLRCARPFGAASVWLSPFGRLTTYLLSILRTEIHRSSGHDGGHGADLQAGAPSLKLAVAAIALEAI